MAKQKKAVVVPSKTTPAKTQIIDKTPEAIVQSEYRYKVSPEMINGIDFPDLPMTFSNGASRPLHVGPDQFIPEELLHEKDLRLSEFGGCIFRSLNAGWVIDMHKENKPTPSKKTEIKTFVPPKSNYTLVETLSPEQFAKMRSESGTVEVMKNIGPQQSVQVEMIKFNGSMPVTPIVIDNRGDNTAVGSTRSGDDVILTPERRIDPNDVVISNDTPGMTAGQIKSYEEFDLLTHFAKLDVIAHTPDLELLKLVAANTQVKQIENNCNGRLREMGQSPVASNVEIR